MTNSRLARRSETRDASAEPFVIRMLIKNVPEVFAWWSLLHRSNRVLRATSHLDAFNDATPPLTARSWSFRLLLHLLLCFLLLLLFLFDSAFNPFCDKARSPPRPLRATRNTCTGADCSAEADPFLDYLDRLSLISRTKWTWRFSKYICRYPYQSIREKRFADTSIGINGLKKCIPFDTTWCFKKIYQHEVWEFQGTRANTVKLEVNEKGSAI